MSEPTPELPPDAPSEEAQASQPVWQPAPGSILYEGEISRARFIQAMRLHSKPGPLGWGLRAMLVGFLVYLFVAYGGQLLNPLLLISIVLVVAVLTMHWWRPYDAARRVYDREDAFHQPVSGWVGPDGILIKAATGENLVKWDAYSGFVQDGDLILMYQQNRWFNLFLREFFASDEDWQRFLSTVRNHMPARRSMM